MVSVPPLAPMVTNRKAPSAMFVQTAWLMSKFVSPPCEMMQPWHHVIAVGTPAGFALSSIASPADAHGPDMSHPTKWFSICAVDVV